jgi:mitochondrial fission protein ELM1
MPDNPDRAEPPRVWVVTGYRAGERAQVLALAEALGWPFEIKELDYRRSAAGISLFRKTSLRGFRMGRSAALAPPWPDVVISAGMRNEPACRWIREQSGGHTRLVHIGRPWGRLEQFDLVIITPQYRFPVRPNVLHNTLTLHRVTKERLRAEAAIWQTQFADLPRPRIAVIVGGDSGPCTFGPRAAHRLAAQANALARAQGGSLLVTTSARTRAAAARVLAGDLAVPNHFYHWRQGDAHNPYFGILALAEAFIVTADSISMLTEACATGKPVYMFDPGNTDFRLTGRLYQGLMRWGPQRMTRDIALVHRYLREAGNAVWLGEAFPDHPPPLLLDMEHAVTRVRALCNGMVWSGTA